MTASALRRLVPLLCAFTLVAGACSSDDGATSGDSTDKRVSTTAADTPIKVGTKVDQEWDGLSGCPIGPPSTDIGGDPADEGIDGVMAYGKQDQTHVDGCVNYPQHPAVGGEHHAAWANCGFYAAPVPEEVTVHVLEHGGVWIAFAPTLDEAGLTKVRAAAASATHVLANPYPGLETGVILTAWSRQLRLDSVDDPRFDKFLETYLEGPQTPEPGAPCDGGIGVPA